MDVQDNVPAVRYEWQRPYLAAALETDSERLPAKISQARHEIQRRASGGVPLDAEEQSAVADALNALATLEKERVNLNGEANQPHHFHLYSEAARSEPSAA